MRPLAFLALLVALLHGPPAHADERVVTKRYTGPGAAIYAACALTSPLLGLDNEVGGACYELAGDERIVEISVRDDNFEDVGGYYYFPGASGISHGFFCGSTWRIDVPPDATRFVVAMDAAVTPVLYCESPPTTGTISATFVTGSPPGAEGSINGTVTDSAGVPVSGACVVGHGPSYRDARTNAAGQYTLDWLPAGSYTVGFSDCSRRRYASQFYDGRASWAAADHVEVAGGPVAGIDAVLEETGSIAGTLASRDGTPLGDACVRAVRIGWEPPPYSDEWNAREAMTDSSGRYRIEGLDPADYHVGFDGCASNPDYAPAWYSGAPTKAEAAAVHVAPGADSGGVDGLLDVGGIISGTVSGADSGLPLKDVSVYVPGEFWRHAETDDSGRYRVLGLPATAARIQFSDWGPSYLPYATEWYDDRPDQSSATPVDVRLGHDTTGIDAVLVRTGAITGKVTSERGDPVLGCAQVFTADGAWARYSFALGGADGTYLVGGLPPGTYKVRFACGYFVSEWYDDVLEEQYATPLVVRSGEATRADAVLALGNAPDPSVAEVSVAAGSGPAGIDTGEGRTVRVTIRNEGTRRAEFPGWLRVEACPATAGRCSDIGETLRVPPLDPDESRDFEIPWETSRGIGEQTVRAELYAGQDAVQSNNVKTVGYSLFVPDAGLGIGV